MSKVTTVYEVIRIKQIIVETKENFIVKSPEDGAEIIANYIGDEDREVLFLMCLNTKNEVIAIHRCHVGSLNASVVHPRELFKTAILNNSASIIMAHNHPSQNVQPSQEDIHVTRKVLESGKVLGIELLDHLIVNANADFYSMKEKGYI